MLQLLNLRLQCLEGLAHVSSLVTELIPGGVGLVAVNYIHRLVIDNSNIIVKEKSNIIDVLSKETRNIEEYTKDNK